MVYCSQSPIFPWDFRDSYILIELQPSWFVKASATLGECPKPPRKGGGRGRQGLDSPQVSRAKIAAVRSKRTSLENPKEKKGTVNSLLTCRERHERNNSLH